MFSELPSTAMGRARSQPGESPNPCELSKAEPATSFRKRVRCRCDNDISTLLGWHVKEAWKAEGPKEKEACPSFIFVAGPGFIWKTSSLAHCFICNFSE